MVFPKTPCDRPGFLISTQQHNPNWISSHIFCPTRASRMLASVLGFESSSSSSSSSECHSSAEDKSCLTFKEVAGIGGANSLPSSGSTMSSELDKEPNHRPINKEEKAAGCRHDNAFRVAAEENCKLLCEASVEAPMVNETDAVASSSQRCSSMHYEGSPQHQNAPISKCNLVGKSNNGIEKQHQVKKMSRYNRRGRGWGR